MNRLLCARRRNSSTPVATSLALRSLAAALALGLSSFSSSNHGQSMTISDTETPS